MKTKYLIGVSIIIGISVLGVITLTVLFFLDIPKNIMISISTWMGIIGTLASIVLSVLAMFYSNKSSTAAEESLNKVNAHYEALCSKINENRIKDNLGDKSILNILEKKQIND